MLLKYVTWGLIDNMVTLVQMMAWRRQGDKPLFVPMFGMLCWTIYELKTVSIWASQCFDKHRHTKGDKKVNMD